MRMMTDQEYYDKLWRQCCGRLISVLIGIGVCILLTMLLSCKTQYVPVETVKTEKVHETDTVYETITITNEKETTIREARPEDSAMLAAMGIKLRENERLLILLQRELRETKDELKEIHGKDSMRADTVRIPYPVEKQLTRRERVEMYSVGFVGGLATVGAAGLLLWIRRRYKRC